MCEAVLRIPEICELECQRSTSHEGDVMSPGFESVILCTVLCCGQFVAESAVVFLGSHTRQLQLCCTMTDKTATAVFAQDRVLVFQEIHHLKSFRQGAVAWDATGRTNVRVNLKLWNLSLRNCAKSKNLMNDWDMVSSWRSNEIHDIAPGSGSPRPSRKLSRTVGKAEEKRVK